MNPNKDFVASGRRFVLAIAGGGAEIIGELTRHGGMSGTLIEATALQDTKATDSYIKGKPDHYVSESTSRSLAMASYRRALALGYEPTGTFGVGVTSSLRSEGEREGRSHRVYLAVQDGWYTWAASATLGKGRSRVEEELLVSRLARKAIDYGAGRATAPIHDLMIWEGDESSSRFKYAEPAWSDLVHGRTDVSHRHHPHSNIVLPTSANPLHEGHLAMAQWAYEISERNADKPPLDYLEIDDRVRGAGGVCNGDKCVGEVFLSSAGTFAEKARIMPGTTFLVGADTFLRLLDKRFGDPTNAHMVIMSHNCDLVVFSREGSPIDKAAIPPALSWITRYADQFTPCPVSSTQIRKNV